MVYFNPDFNKKDLPNQQEGIYLIFKAHKKLKFPGIVREIGEKLCVLLMIGFLLIGQNAFAQENTAKGPSYFRGNISVTNNGLSLIPAFSLGRPAAIFELSMGGERLSFDPELRFALDGRPWSFILWWRYKVVKSEKFNLHIGAHPAYIFTTTMEPDANGQMVETTKVQSFFAGEISPSYTFSPKIKLSFLYLAGRSLGKVPFALNQFVALGPSFTDIYLSKKIFFNARPNLFYLKMNEKDGYFASASLAVSRKNFPISLGGIVSKKIVSEIEVDDWIWNLSLIYSFNNKFVKSSNPIL